MTSHSNVPKIHVLPDILWRPTTAFSSRHGVKPTLIVIHRWAGGTFDSVVKMFHDSPHGPEGKSSTFVYAGEQGKDAGKFAQMVKIADKPWTQAAWNPHCISIECADAIFTGTDHVGLERLGHIIAGLCHYEHIEPLWVTDKLMSKPDGVCRHHDLGVLGGNHPNCPTTDIRKWMLLMDYVKREYKAKGFRTKQAWGLR